MITDASLIHLNWSIDLTFLTAKTKWREGEQFRNWTNHHRWFMGCGSDHMKCDAWLLMIDNTVEWDMSMYQANTKVCQLR